MKTITPLDPDSPAGRRLAEELSQVLAEIQVAIWQRQQQNDASRRAA